MSGEVMDHGKIDLQIALCNTTKDNCKDGTRADVELASLPVLPNDADVKYMNEGSANIIYTLSVGPIHDKPLSSVRDASYASRDEKAEANVWDGKLLRLRKELPWTAPCAVAHADYLLKVYPLFNSEYLVEQRLVDVKSSGIIQKLNHQLQEWDNMQKGHRGSRGDLRLTRWNGIYLANDNHGLLVKDMTPARPSDAKLVEFKPKWLTQSRSAPELSKRCRTCAKRARTNASRARVGEAPLRQYCPLDLVSNDDAAVDRAVRAILSITDPVSSGDGVRIYRLSQWIRESSMLSRLAALQFTLDTVGVFAANPTNSQFLTAMTLRDCSIFLQFPEYDLAVPITAKIGDLDLKRSEKAEYWKDVERPLIQEGWYMGMESERDKQPLDCNLSPMF